MSTSATKEQAEALRIGLAAGYLTPADAVRWADDLIASEPHPDAALLDVSLAGSRPWREVATLLADVPGDCDPEAVMRRSLGEMLVLVRADPARADDVARWLYELSVSGFLPDEPFGWQASALDDSFDLARRTIVPREDAVRQLLEYLEQQSRPALLRDPDSRPGRSAGEGGP